LRGAGDGKAAAVRVDEGGAMLRGIAIVLLALVLGVGLAACGDDDDNGNGGTTTTEETTTETTDTTTTDDDDDDTTTDETDETTTAAGRDVFVAQCGSCHTLSDAGTSGTVGPNLDETTLEEDDIEEQVREGGGGMPSFEGQLSDGEIEAVAEYVASQN
jgi:mono/diheme cytochrome c family protein